MKKTFLLLVLSIVALCTVDAQIYFSCTHRNIYQYNDYTDEYEYINGYDENSLFKINDDVTMFEHTTPSISSSYYINESDLDEDNGVFSFEVTSDVGNKYHYIFDVANDQVRVVYPKNGEVIMIVFTVKKMWYDE